MDKIVYFTSGTLNANQTDITTPHKLPFTPLLFGVCAFNEDFSDARSVPFQYLTQQNTIQFIASANSTNVRLSYINYSGSPAKIYYRLYGFEPSDSRGTVGATSKHAKQFILNTDYNYCKLYKKGIAAVGDTITHNLGYIPQTLVWQQANGWVFLVENSSTSAAIIITDTAITFNYPSLGTDKFHYRIYYDQA
jgi:hypothetical protein